MDQVPLDDVAYDPEEDNNVDFVTDCVVYGCVLFVLTQLAPEFELGAVTNQCAF